MVLAAHDKELLAIPDAFTRFLSDRKRFIVRADEKLDCVCGAAKGDSRVRGEFVSVPVSDRVAAKFPLTFNILVACRAVCPSQTRRYWDVPERKRNM